MDDTNPPYLTSDLPVETRVEDLLGRMTLDERVGQIFLTGPQADSQMILEDWSVEQPAEHVITVLQAIVL